MMRKCCPLFPRTLISVCVLLGSVLPLAAQDTPELPTIPTDGAQLVYEYMPSSGLGGGALKDAEVETEELSFRFGVPFFFHEERTILLNGFAYRWVGLQLDDWDPANGYIPQDLHAISYTLGVRRKLSEKSNIDAFLRTALVSDLEEIDSDHYRLDAGVVYTRRPNPHFRWTVGVAFGDDLGEPMVLPVLRAQWVKKRYRAEIFVPKRLEIFYTPSRNYEFGLAFRAIGNHFRIGSKKSPVHKPSLKYRRFAIGPEASVRLKGPIYLTATAGWVFGRTADLLDFDGDELLSIDPEDTSFVRAGILYRIW